MEQNVFSLMSEASWASQNPQTVEAAYKVAHALYKDGLVGEQLHVTFAWIAYRYLKANYENLGSHESRKVLALYLRLTPERPSVLHSSFLFLAMKIKKKYPDFKFLSFLSLWGFQNFRMEDWDQRTYQGHEFPSAVMQAVGVAWEEAKQEHFSNIPVELADLMRKAVRKYPDDIFLKRKLAKMLLQKDGREEALQLYRQMLIKEKQYYLWEELAGIVDDADLHISALCKALTLQKKDEFTGKIHLALAELLIKKEDYAQALYDLNRYSDTYARNQWSVKTDYYALKSHIPAETIPAKRSIAWLREMSQAAEEFVVGQLPSWVMYVQSEFQDRNGRMQYKMVSHNGLSLAVPRKMLPASLGSELIELYEVRYVENDGRKKAVSVRLADLSDPSNPFHGKLTEQKGKLIIKTNAKGDKFGFVHNCYVAGFLLKEMNNGDFVRVVAMKDGQKQHALKVLTQEASS